MNFGLKLFLFVGQQVDLDVGVGGAAHVERRQLLALDHSHRQVVGVEVVLQLKQTRIIAEVLCWSRADQSPAVDS